MTMTQATDSKTAAHTPGPWSYGQDDGNRLDRYVLAGNQGPFGHFQGWAGDGVTTEAEDEANAQLIARAPELLAENERLREALRIVVASGPLHNGMRDDAALAIAREALAAKREFVAVSASEFRAAMERASAHTPETYQRATQAHLEKLRNP